MTSDGVVIEGRGLHLGEPARITIFPRPGPTTLERGAPREARVRIDELAVVDTSRSTNVATSDGRFHLATVEHLFSALGAFAAHAGIGVAIEGPEPPLADGAARVFADVLATFELPRSRPRLRVVETRAFDVGRSTYAFAPKDAIDVTVEVIYDEPAFSATASWAGDPDDFRSRIASARTFSVVADIEELLAKNLARHIAKESVVMLTKDGPLFAGAPFLPDEPARHKLLDLVGDLFLYGGPPLGSLHVTRPGHGATHVALARALATGIVVVDRS